MARYPSWNSGFLSRNKNKDFQVPEYDDHKVKDKDIVEVLDQNGWLLIPAGIGTMAYYLMYLLFFKDQKNSHKKSPNRVRPGVIVYSTISTLAISVYIYDILIVSGGKLPLAYGPISWALTTWIVYFAAAYSWVNLLEPNSFNPNVDADIISEIITFIYFSLATFSTAGGELAPITNTTKILVSIQVGFFVFIFTMGMVFFIGQ